MRLGFVVSSLAKPELRSHDGRRWQNGPHLSVSLIHLRDMITYVNSRQIRMYRLSASLAPYATHPDMPAFADQIGQCTDELAEVGSLARNAGIRLSIHLPPYAVLNALDRRLAARSRAEVTLQAALLDAMHLGDDAVLVTHLGAAYGNSVSARHRFVEAFVELPAAAQRRLVLENDDTRFNVADILEIHAATGIRLVFDVLHHRLNNPSGIPLRDALASCLASWPKSQTPKIHFSSPRTEWLSVPGQSPDAPRLRRSRWSRHSDFINPFEFIDLVRLAAGLRAFDIMLEARGRDLALLQLRADLATFAPELAESLEIAVPAENLHTSALPERSGLPSRK